MNDYERIEQLELENKVLKDNNKGLKAKINELQKELDKKDKVIDLMAKERAEISDEIPVPAEAIINYYLKMVEEENETN